MAVKKVLSVGQCGADHWSLSKTLQMHFEVEIEQADSAPETLSLLQDGHFDLVLINRVLDGDGSSGVELVKRIKADASLQRVAVMLVSNYDDYQRQAVAAGALPGFGKAALGQPTMLGRVREVLNS
jgi:two-component system, chemotaxis family, chemotaxis protein CheY